MGYFDNTKFLLDFANELYTERPLQNEMEVSEGLRQKIDFMEGMAKMNRSVYSIFDFTVGEYLYHSNNLHHMLGYRSSLPLGKVRDVFTNFIPERRYVEKYLELVKLVFSTVDQEEKEHLKGAVVGPVIESLDGKKFRCCYMARPLSFAENGRIKFSFDSVADFQSILVSEPGCWMRFSTNKRVFHWQSSTNKFVEKDLVLPRELEILQLWQKGSSIPEIARDSNRSVFTVKNQLTNLRNRLLVRDNSSAVQVCVMTGIIKGSF
jgi:DNA-binding CsgD family transcriptional regulator